jgi:flagellar biosynthesis protein FliR
MDELLHDLSTNALSPGSQDLLVHWGSLHLRTFLFVAARLTGFLLPMMKIWGGSFPRQFGILLILFLSLILTPSVEMVQGSLVTLPPAPSQWPWTICLEFGVGMALGLGAVLILGSLQMAGDLIGAQLGLRPQQVLLATAEDGTSLTGQMLLLLGIGAFLLLPPLVPEGRGGALLLVDSFVQTFHSFPAGTEAIPQNLGQIALGWLQHSISLSLSIAAPVLACATLVSLFVATLGRALPEANTMLIGFPLRSVVCLSVLLLVLSGVTEQIAAEVPEILKQIQETLSGSVRGAV